MGRAHRQAEGIHAVRRGRNRRADIPSGGRGRSSRSSVASATFDRVPGRVYRREETSMDQRLKGRRIAALAADGFEKVELVVPMKALQAAGAHVDVISLRHGHIRGVNLHEPASRVHVDKTIAEANPDEYDGLLLPGGFINPALLRQSAEARAFVRAFDEARKPIASLCHGPWVLASAGLLQGRTLTSWPGVRDDLGNAGATWLDQPLVRDGNLATSRGPQDLGPFVKGCLDVFAEH